MRLVLSLLALLASEAVLANGTVTGTVVNVRVDNNGKGMVYFYHNLVGYAGCVQPGYENVLAFDTATAGGRAILARVLAAQATGEEIKATGTGACAIYGNGWAEDWLYGGYE